MKLSSYTSCFVSLLVMVFMHGYALADDPNLGSSKILAVVPVKSGNINQSVYRQFDRLVPELKKISRNNIVKLDCRYSGRPDREQDVEKAYKLVANIEKYLRVRHKLDLDLWVAIDVKPKYANSPPLLTIAVLSDDIKKLGTVIIDPQKK